MVAIQAVVAIGQFVTQGSLGLYALGELRLDPSNPDLAAVLREDWVLGPAGASTVLPVGSNWTLIALGLSIVESIANAHDGTLTLTPCAGGGLCVAVQLPAQRDRVDRVVEPRVTFAEF